MSEFTDSIFNQTDTLRMQHDKIIAFMPSDEHRRLSKENKDDLASRLKDIKDYLVIASCA